jgi:hypothetical protein
MSKMDNLRAMREARYDKAVARADQAGSARATTSAVRIKPAARASAPFAEAGPPAEAAAEAAGEELCGHRNMSGRTCTREKGHSAKSHRYS